VSSRQAIAIQFNSLIIGAMLVGESCSSE